MKVLVVRGYDSHESFDETIYVKMQAISVTIVHIGKPIFLKKKLKNIMSKYALDNYDIAKTT